MSFIRDVWGGHDYLPQVWDSWLGQKDSAMFVVLVDGKQVGMNRVRFLEDGTAWFEGARVHPEYRGRGLASMLGERSMEVARARGVDNFRLTSGSRNKLAHRQIRRIGFTETARFSVYVPAEGARFETMRGVRTAERRELSRVMRQIVRSREFVLGAGVMWDTFAALSLTEATVGRAVKEGRVYLGGDSLAMVKLGGEGKEVWNQICFLTGEGPEPIRLAGHLFRERRGPRVDRRLAYLPQGSRLVREARAAGMERDFSLILFERRAANG